MSKDIRFDPENGFTTFMDSRLLIIATEAMGLLRHKLIEAIGMEKARELLLQYGYQNGFSDFLQMKLSHEFDTESDLLASGPVIHTYEGIVKSVPEAFTWDREKGDFYHLGIWTNSWEAEQHLTFYQASKEPVCWTLMGYASGWCTAFFGAKIVAIEKECVGKGDATCKVEAKPPGDWDEKAKPYINALKDF